MIKNTTRWSQPRGGTTRAAVARDYTRHLRASTHAQERHNPAGHKMDVAPTHRTSRHAYAHLRTFSGEKKSIRVRKQLTCGMAHLECRRRAAPKANVLRAKPLQRSPPSTGCSTHLLPPNFLRGCARRRPASSVITGACQSDSVSRRA